MKDHVVIKGGRSGMTVILDPEAPYEQLLSDTARKFSETARFWGSARMTLTLAGRPLSPEQEFAIVDVIMANSDLEILCLLDQDQERTRRCEKALNDRLMELSGATGQFRRGDLCAGDTLESEYSVAVIGNVEPGARVVSGGSVVVVGDLKGAVAAGTSGDTGACVAALDMAPSQLVIAGRPVPCPGRGKRLARGPVMVTIEDGEICVKSMKKGLFQK